jgi:hypothetical protein
MTGSTWPIALFCLTSGAALGALFLLCKALRLALGGGKLLTAALDTAFGLVCGAVVFLCALAVDKGRLRLLQAALQALGAWGVVVSLDPLATAGGKLLRFLWKKISCFLSAPFRWAKGKLARWKKARKKKNFPIGRRGSKKKPRRKGAGFEKNPPYAKKPEKST